MTYLLGIMLVLLLPSTAVLENVIISLETAVKTSDIIVIGTLKNVSEETKNGIDYGTGEIMTDEVLFGNVKENEKLILVWQNQTNDDCPRVEHRNRQNKPAIWLLTQKTNEEVTADNSGRVVSVEKKENVLQLIREIQLGNFETRNNLKVKR